MRISGGQYRGRVLATPPGKNTRPTAGRTRESIFNILDHNDWCTLSAARVIDLFAGSGALGFDALSRGAEFCLFVETDANARGIIRDNIESLGLFGATRIHRRDATDLGKKPAPLGEPFDLVFLDPPYHKDLGEKALAELINGGWLAENTLAIFECAADEDPQTPGWETLDQRTYGAAKVLFLRQH
ncbi:MAG: 16S rRNA (guanine(966)-N(2))-methyltransferase RsmD [Robiginitomaculum sp.]|nr:MAG: 16S rRNA (guanine(966)-N(2))-methyltransferase RsmD [Robiginitomaculum sp.]